MNSRFLNFVKPRVGEVWRDMTTRELVEVVEVGMKYAVVKRPGGDPRFKHMVRFKELQAVSADEIPAPPPSTSRPSESDLNEEFLDDAS